MQEQFAQKMIEILNLFTETQSENMKTVADIIVDRIKEGGRFFVFGTGHSHMVGEEFYARAGGLACVQLIAPMELTLGEHPLKSTQIERIAEYAHVIMMQYGF
ncbi:MAG: SIS domain-containing protein, partial [Coprobacillus cateniformis]